jgi:hypothetical protein
LCGADVGFIYHLAILVNADTDTLVKGQFVQTGQRSKALRPPHGAIC